MMTIEEISYELTMLSLPCFVDEMWANAESFNRFADVGRDYTLRVNLKDRERNPYRPGDFKPQSNHPFTFPADVDELRAQVAGAILMAVAHETLEQISDGGKHLCDPHRHKGGSTPDTVQWLGLLDSLHLSVRHYAAEMPAR